MADLKSIPYGFCRCGCGQKTRLATRNHTAYGWRKGKPLRFIAGHKQRQEGRYRRMAVTRDGVEKIVAAHRVKAERALGRPLPPGVEVHHLDGTKSDHSPLVICQDKAYHALLHVRARVLRAGGDPDTQRICSGCKKLVAIDTLVKGRDHCRPCQREMNVRHRERRLRQAASGCATCHIVASFPTRCPLCGTSLRANQNHNCARQLPVFGDPR